MTEALGRVVATERKPNTPHEFHFWTSLDSPVGIGTIVRVDGAHPVEGRIPHIYGIVVEGFSYTDLQSPMYDVLSHDGIPSKAGFAKASFSVAPPPVAKNAPGNSVPLKAAPKSVESTVVPKGASDPAKKPEVKPPAPARPN